MAGKTLRGEAAGGLEGVVVAETALSWVDGEGGRLVLRGHALEELAGRRPFEDVCALLWDGALPDAAGREAVRRLLADGRRRAFAELRRADAALAAPGPMDALRGAMALLPESADRGLLAGAVAVFAAAWLRRRRGGVPLAPDPGLPHAADLLRLVEGRRASAPRSAALDAYLVCVAEHGMNASTFAARVVASTHSDPVSAAVAALGALKGPLHGGAPGPVLDMLDDIGHQARALPWLRAELAAGRRLMGLGHRVYRVRDPRAAVLEAAVERLEASGASSRYLRLARAVERAAVDLLAERHPERRLDVNVEFYTAVLLDAIGFPRDFFTPLFACGRVAGWLAHVEEQRERGRLLRPSQRYTGAIPGAPAAA
jgi:citrate synthase